MMPIIWVRGKEDAFRKTCLICKPNSTTTKQVRVGDVVYHYNLQRNVSRCFGRKTRDAPTVYRGL